MSLGTRLVYQLLSTHSSAKVTFVILPYRPDIAKGISKPLPGHGAFVLFLCLFDFIKLVENFLAKPLKCIKVQRLIWPFHRGL